VKRTSATADVPRATRWWARSAAFYVMAEAITRKAKAGRQLSRRRGNEPHVELEVLGGAEQLRRGGAAGSGGVGRGRRVYPPMWSVRLTG
jgi:hypothetical protein